MKHTSSKWVLGSPWNAILAGPGTYRAIATVHTCTDNWGMKPISEAEARANAERIVACVNAMEGIEDPLSLRLFLDTSPAEHAVDMLEMLKRAGRGEATQEEIRALLNRIGSATE